MLFVETPVFTRELRDLMSDDDYRMLLGYRKSRQEDLTPQQLRVLRKLVKENLK